MPGNLLAGSLAFLNPWVLAALAILPLLWLFLRVTPPSPKRIAFPAARFLKDLIPEEMSPSKTPWWLLLLRLLLLALLIIGLAHPVSNLSRDLDTQKPLRLVIDNDWASAGLWNDKLREGMDILSQAKRAELPVTLLTTAPEGETKEPQIYGPMTAAEAETILRGLTPKPWKADYKALAQKITDNSPQEPPQTLWLSDGVQKEGLRALAGALNNSGSVRYMQPESYDLPMVLKADSEFSNKPSVTLLLPRGETRPQNLSIQALAQDGRVIGHVPVTPKPSENTVRVQFDIPDVLRGEIARIVISGTRSAASTYLIDDQFVRRNVGLVSADESAEDKPLIEAGYYLERALEPYANLTSGTVENLLDANVSAILMPDMASLPVETLNKLESWVNNGGLLLRFAGPNMTQNLSAQFLVPMPLRASGRALSGSLSWEDPLKLGPFPDSSPFYGMAVPGDVIVRQQILAEPSQDLQDKTWAVLEDGTPLITAAQQEDGLLVFVHTTATPEWSDLALSGAYVNILRRIINMSGRQIQSQRMASKTLEPLSVMDGFGALNPPGSTVKPISLQSAEEFRVSPAHPPGLYGRAGVRQALNLGDSITTIEPATLPASLQKLVYDSSYETDYRPYLYTAALALLFLDWMVLMILNSSWHLGALRKAKIATLVLFVLLTLPAQPAKADAVFDLKYSDELYLAYIKTGVSSIDVTAQQGLEVLASVLAQRTSVEPAGAVGLNPERDTLAFFPLIYWPVSGNEKPLSLEAIQKIQSYLNHGGTILFDTRDQNMTARRLGGSRNAETLRRMINGLNIPALTPIPETHVLGKSFYLLSTFPGQYTGGTLWVEGESESGRDGVSSVLIGSHDWASAWAAAGQSRGGIIGSNRQQELALRFGVNLMMYALTGNYKADQVHVPHILERLGQ